MMRIFKAIITPLVLFSIIFSPIMTGAALAVTKEECEAQNKKYVSGGGYTYCTDLVYESTSESEGETFIKGQLQGGSSLSLKGDNKIGSCTVVEANFLNGIISSGAALLVANIAISLLNDVPYIGGGAEPFDDALDQLNSAWIGAALWGTAASVIIWIEGYLIQLAFLLNSNITTDNPVITTGFNVTLGIVNIGFVIVLVLMGIMTILRRTNWLAQKRLPNLILAVVLVNFSLFIAGLLINISNVFTGALLANSCATNLFGYLNVGAVFNLVQPAIGSVLNPLVGTGGIILAALFSVIGALTLGAIFLFLIIRYVMIVILLVFMPIAWLGFVVPEIEIPGVGNPWKKWWGEFTKWLIVGPIIAFSLYLTLTLLQNMGEITSKATKIPLTGVALDGLLNITAAMIMSLLGIFIAIKGSGMAGALIATGLGSGAALAMRGMQGLGQVVGFGGATRLQEKATRLEAEARKERDAGNITKARELETKAKEAAKLASWSAQLGAGAQTTPVGLKQVLDQAGIKGLPKEAEKRVAGGAEALDAARAWKGKAISESGKEIGLDKKNEDEVASEIQRLLEDRKKTLIPGKRIAIDNQLAAAYKHLSDKGALHKLGEEEFNHLSNADFAQHLAVMGVKIDPSKRYEKASAETAVKDLNNATSKMEEIRRAIPDKEDPRRKQAEDMLNSIRVAAAEKLSKPDAFNSLTAGQQTLLTGTILSSDFRKAIEKKGKSIQEFTDSYIKNIPLDQVANQITTIQGRRGTPGIDDKSINTALVSALDRAKKTGKLGDVDIATRTNLIFNPDLQSQMNKMGIDPKSFEGSVGMNADMKSIFEGMKIAGTTNLTTNQKAEITEWLSSVQPKDFSVSSIFSNDASKNSLLSAIDLDTAQVTEIQKVFADTLAAGGKKGGGALNVLKNADASSFERAARIFHDQAKASGNNQLAKQIEEAAKKRNVII